VRALLDESLPRDLAHELRGHDVESVQRRGWSGLSNGELLLAAREAGFAALLTADRNMEHQQDIARSGLAVIVLRSLTNRLPDLVPLVPKLLEVLRTIRPGQVAHVDA
jgi:Domain of unknown function (DUF5615)